MSQILWDNLRELISDRIGFCIRQQDLKYFQDKIRARIKETGCHDLKEYYCLLDKAAINSTQLALSKTSLGTKEWGILANIITNGESFFFRDRGQFDLLANDILPKIIEDKRQAYQTGKTPYLTLKIWSAGCSTGEEVYSLATVVSESIPDPERWNIVIIGTDINQDFLQKARQGKYKQWSFRLTDPKSRQKYFINDGQYWHVKPHLKSMVTFYQDNLIDVNNATHHNYDLDLVICRNVFIYFETKSIVRAIEKISHTLRIGGYLIAGHAELQDIDLAKFKIISFPDSVVYQYLGIEKQNDNPSSAKKYPNFANDMDKLSSNNKIKFSNTERSKNSNLQHKSVNYISSKLPIKARSQKTLSNKTNKPIELNTIKKAIEKEAFNEAIALGKKLIEQNFENSELDCLLAKAYANQGDFKQAKEYCDRALEIDSMSIEPVFLLVQIAKTQNDNRTAKKLLKRIIYLEPSCFAAYLDLGAIYSKEKDIKRSKKMYLAAYNILQDFSLDKKIEYQKQTNVRNLLDYVKTKL